MWASVGSELLKLQFQPWELDATIKGRHSHVGQDHAEWASEQKGCLFKETGLERIKTCPACSDTSLLINERSAQRAAHRLSHRASRGKRHGSLYHRGLGWRDFIIACKLAG